MGAGNMKRKDGKPRLPYFPYKVHATQHCVYRIAYQNVLRKFVVYQTPLLYGIMAGNGQAVKTFDSHSEATQWIHAQQSTAQDAEGGES